MKHSIEPGAGNECSGPETFEVEFTTTAGRKEDGRLVFDLGPYDESDTYYFIDDVTLERVADCVSGACGDGLLDGNEQCDDGNLAAGDGCGSDRTP